MARLAFLAALLVSAVLWTSECFRKPTDGADLIADGPVQQSPSSDDIFHGKVPTGYLSNVGVMASEKQILKFIRNNSYSLEQQMQKMVNTLHNFDQSDSFGMLQPEDLEPSDDHKQNLLKLMWAFCGKKRPICMTWNTAAMDIFFPDLSNPSEIRTYQLVQHGMWYSWSGASQVKEYLESIPNSEKFPLSCQDPMNRVLIHDTNFNGWHLIHLLGGMELAYVPQWLYEKMGEAWNYIESGIHAGSHDGAWEKANQCQEQESGLQIGFIDVWKPTAADLYYRDLGRKWMTQWMIDKQLPEVTD